MEAAFRRFGRLGFQGGSGTEPEPETGTVGTVFPETESGTGTRRNRFPGTETGTGTVLSCQTVLKHRQTFLEEEPLEPKTGTARTVPFPNRNRTEPNQGLPGVCSFKSHAGCSFATLALSGRDGSRHSSDQHPKDVHSVWKMLPNFRSVL